MPQTDQQAAKESVSRSSNLLCSDDARQGSSGLVRSGLVGHICGLQFGSDFR